MNLKHLLILFCLLRWVPVSGQLIWSNPQPSGFINNKILFSDASNGFIMNSHGDLIRTNDGGNKWEITKNFSGCRTMDAKDTFFVIGGGDTIIHISSDRAQTWTKRVLKHHSVIDKIQIISRDTLFVLCKNSNVGTTEFFRSTDGGVNWQLMNNTFIIKAVDFVNSNLGYASSFGGIFKTVNGGLSWQQVYTEGPGYSFWAVKFKDANTGIASRESNVVIRTRDGGVTWDTCFDISATFYDISFVGENNIFLAGDNGTIFRSLDAGQTWEHKSNHTGDADGLFSMYFTSPAQGYFVGMRGQIFKTEDAGDSYTDYSPTYEDVRPLSFPTAAIGYAGSWSILLKTADTGHVWTPLPAMPGHTPDRWFQYVHFFTADTGIALLENPVAVYKTENGGLNWRHIPLPWQYTDYIEGFAVTKNSVYISTDGPYGYGMFQSLDSAESWNIQGQFLSDSRRNLFFVDEKTGYSSAGPYLYKTTDSAKTWTPIFTTSGYTINSIWFANAANGYFVSTDDNYMTRDSGRTWTRFSIWPDNFNFNDIYSIRFFDKKVGYLVSAEGIFKTANGGLTWRAEESLPGDCFTIEMTSDTTVFFGGTYGAILRKDMREYAIDSFRLVSNAACSAMVAMDVTAVLSQVDSIWIEYGTSSFERFILTSPASVKDSTIKYNVAIPYISADSTYSMRVKILYRGFYYYSDPITFKPTGPLKPVITLAGSQLISSASTGNQWYLNGVAIPGATGTAYQPVSSGIYSVQQTINGCAGAISEGFNFTLTALNDPILAESLSVFPNPVSSIFHIRNKKGKKLQISLIDIWGRTILVSASSKVDTELDLQHLSSGYYILLIRDFITKRQVAVKIIKE